MEPYESTIPSLSALSELRFGAGGDICVQVTGSDLTTTVKVMCEDTPLVELFWTRGSSRCTVYTDRPWIRRVFPPLDSYGTFDAW